MLSSFGTHGLSSFLKVVQTIHDLTRTVTYLTIRRVIQSWRERDLSGERVFFNPHLELAEHIGRHFESCRRTSPSFIMVVFVLSKWAEFNELTLHKNMYQEFLVRTQMFTCLSVNDPTK
jgi:hypothetical protein